MYYLSLSRLSGNLEPGGKSGFSSGLLGSGSSFELVAFEEFPAFPDLTMPRFGGIGQDQESVHKKEKIRDRMSPIRGQGASVTSHLSDPSHARLIPPRSLARLLFVDTV